MSQNGKGDAPRNCFSKEFRNNFEAIDWGRKKVSKIFYFTTRDPRLQGDFQEISMLIGLRNEFGDRVIDTPRKNVVYGDFSESPKESLHGRGFTYYKGDVKDIDDIYRMFVPTEDDIIIYGTVEYGILNEKRDHGTCKNIFYIDGGDVPDIRIKPCFKRELFTPEEDVFPTGFGIPISEIADIDFSVKDQLIPKTTPDTDLIEKFDIKPKVHFHPTMSSYHFEEEADYKGDIRRSWFFPVTKRGGWDSLRPYQGIAYGTLVIFKKYSEKPKLCSPQKLPCLEYGTPDELMEIMNRLVVDNKPTEEYKDLLAQQRIWLHNCGTCEARARKLMEKINERL